MIVENKFKRKLKPTEEGFVQVVQYFFGNQRAETDSELVDTMPKAHQLMSARISQTAYFLHYYLDFFFFTPNLANEHGEDFTKK